MKKKIIALTAAGLIAVSGVVSAASLWGTYKGNSIIRLTIDGKPTEVTDVPVINYNDRTMIPIYLLNQAGVRYVWDQKNQTVNILKDSVYSPSDTKDYAVGWLQTYYRITNELKNMNDFSQSMIIHFYSVMDVHDSISGAGNVDDSIKFAEDGEKQYTDTYSEIKKRINDLIPLMNQYALDSSSITQALDLLGQSLDHFEKALTAIKHYSNGRNVNDSNDFYDELQKGGDANSKANGIITSQYEHYYQSIVNYK